MKILYSCDVDDVLLSTRCNIPEDLNPYQQGGENL